MLQKGKTRIMINRNLIGNSNEFGANRRGEVKNENSLEMDKLLIKRCC